MNNQKGRPPGLPGLVGGMSSEEMQQRSMQREILSKPQYGEKSSFRVKMRNAWLVCERLVPEKSHGGIYAPGGQEDFATFVVRAVGMGRHNAMGSENPMPYSVGEELIVHGSPIAHMHKGVSLFLVQADQVICSVEDIEQ